MGDSGLISYSSLLLQLTIRNYTDIVYPFLIISDSYSLRNQSATTHLSEGCEFICGVESISLMRFILFVVDTRRVVWETLFF